MKTILVFCKEHKRITFFFLCAIFLVSIGIFAPFLCPYHYLEIDLSDVTQPPSKEHWFGTDQLGRDVFSRVLIGTRTSLSSSLLLMILTMFIGSFLGMLAGYFGGVIEVIIMRTADVLISFPGYVLGIAIAGIMGTSLKNALLAIFIVSWPKYTRLARSKVLQIKSKDYMKAAILAGSPFIYVFKNYIWSISMPLILVTGTMDIGTMMMELSALSFLGFGAQPPMPEWGLMLSEGRNLMQTAPWMMFFPGLAIFLVVAVFNLLGDSLTKDHYR